MSSTSVRLNEVFEHARLTPIPFDDDSKFILFSDCHRGDNTWADDFVHNESTYFFALGHYLDEGFTLIEVGDGDELWENSDFSEIRRQHDHVFWRMRQFFLKDRLFLLFGNHDIERQDPKVVEQQLFHYVDDRTGQTMDLFPGIRVHEGLVLRHRVTGQEILLVHGHQGSAANEQRWRLSRFAVRHFWRHLQLLGVPDPTQPSQNLKARNEVETKIIAWIATRHQMLICGHTHRSRFPKRDDPPYFNVGSAVHPRCVTGIEIRDGTITLIKWWISAGEGGKLTIIRDELAGPEPLTSFAAPVSAVPQSSGIN
jgi:UDP-2,3-diacylglucosamine pyrophosphatase LpxH